MAVLGVAPDNYPGILANRSPPGNPPPQDLPGDDWLQRPHQIENQCQEPLELALDDHVCRGTCKSS